MGISGALKWAIRDPLLRHPQNRASRARENFRENFGKFPGAGPGRPGTPAGTPRRDPQNGPENGPFFGPYIVYMYITDPPGRGCQEGALLAPPGGPPRGGKKCTFFWVFNNSPSRDSLRPPRAFFPSRFWGQFGGYPFGSVFIGSIQPMRSMHCRAVALGRRASDGYPLRGLTRNGWYVPFGRATPSKQGRKSAQYR